MKNSARTYSYLKVQLKFEHKPPELGAFQVKNLIIAGLQQFYGIQGSAIEIDILTFEPNSLTFIIRVDTRDFQNLWTSLTLVNSYDGKSCRFDVLKTSISLVSLACASRDYQF